MHRGHRVPRFTHPALVATREFFFLAEREVFQYTFRQGGFRLGDPDEICWVSYSRILRVLFVVVNHAGAVLASPKHRKGKVLQTIAGNHVVVNEEELVCTSDN